MSENLTITPEVESKIKGSMFSHPRELSGHVLNSIENVLIKYEGINPSQYIEKWYRTADVAKYDSTEAASAYLGAYGPRSILKYQEALFSLILIKQFLPKSLRIIDYGAGPCVGFAAIIDLLENVSLLTRDAFEIDYTAIDRSDYMLQIGEELCKQISSNSSLSVAYRLKNTLNPHEDDSDIGIFSNILNEGEGNDNCSEFFSEVFQLIIEPEDLILIEPATERASRQLCGIHKHLGSYTHIGPCPSRGSECDAWSFRQFNKRSYKFEENCLGKWASASRISKYSLALLSMSSDIRKIEPQQEVVISRRSNSGYANTCRFGNSSRKKVAIQAEPWDIVNVTGEIERYWP